MSLRHEVRCRFAPFGSLCNLILSLTCRLDPVDCNQICQSPAGLGGAGLRVLTLDHCEHENQGEVQRAAAAGRCQASLLTHTHLYEQLLLVISFALTKIILLYDNFLPASLSSLLEQYKVNQRKRERIYISSVLNIRSTGILDN